MVKQKGVRQNTSVKAFEEIFSDTGVQRGWSLGAVFSALVPLHTLLVRTACVEKTL